MELSEKLFYMCLIPSLVLLAILIPIVVIKSGPSSPRYIYLGNNVEGIGDGSGFELSSIDGADYANKYYTVADLYDYLKDFALSRSMFYSVEEVKEKKLKDGIIKVTLKKSDQTHPLVLIVSGLLSGDWGSVTTSLYLMNKFYEEFDTTNALLNAYNFQFLPLMEPTGYTYSQELPIYQNHKSSHKIRCAADILHDFGVTPVSDEANWFYNYVTTNKEQIKGIFFLFTPEAQRYRNKSFFTYPMRFFESNHGKDNFYNKLSVAVAQESGTSFSYLPPNGTEEFFTREYTKSRIDEWTAGMSKPKPIMVMDFLTNYKPRDPDSLHAKTKEIGDSIYSIISTILQIIHQRAEFER